MPPSNPIWLDVDYAGIEMRIMAQLSLTPPMHSFEMGASVGHSLCFKCLYGGDHAVSKDGESPWKRQAMSLDEAHRDHLMRIRAARPKKKSRYQRIRENADLD